MGGGAERGVDGVGSIGSEVRRVAVEATGMVLVGRVISLCLLRNREG